MASCESDASCVFECIIATSTCNYYCPCYDGCPLGCQGCSSKLCTCRDIENDPNFVACDNYQREVYIGCIDICMPGDFECLSDCNRDYEENLKDCPCNENCPSGSSSTRNVIFSLYLSNRIKRLPMPELFVRHN